MEEMGKTDIQLQRPIKTEWNPRCVLFTYFQGDIGSVVDEHFSRALSNVKSPQGLSPLSQSTDVILRNDSDMPPNQWRFSSPWTKPEPEASFAYGATNCSLNGPSLMTPDQYPVSLAGSPSVQSDELWHYPSLGSPSSSEPGYSQAYSSAHMVPEPQPDGKYEPFLSLLQQDRHLAHPQESAVWEDCSSAQVARSVGLLCDLPPSSAHDKKIYFPPDGGPASANLASEKSQSPERRNVFFY
ncbi:transcription cofactor vestigial-like protein 1 [Leptonychotes weddellii]|uniref:Transcription cofactor vestigial-like protein 1 n=1 Tax=Leptonychotes weddellii TaxID=9713 RepID=A0A7F8RV78_LEPWE|nr:transcription cofactor vestigial-like protein 1 [Leptonychotes weddellii]XP_035921552.1 transcription cofactor vestigial-like protein 1 [Halichoerus grypus]